MRYVGCFLVLSVSFFFTNCAGSDSVSSKRGVGVCATSGSYAVQGATVNAYAQNTDGTRGALWGTGGPTAANGCATVYGDSATANQAMVFEAAGDQARLVTVSKQSFNIFPVGNLQAAAVKKAPAMHAVVANLKKFTQGRVLTINPLVEKQAGNVASRLTKKTQSIRKLQTLHLQSLSNVRLFDTFEDELENDIKVATQETIIQFGLTKLAKADVDLTVEVDPSVSTDTSSGTTTADTDTNNFQTAADAVVQGFMTVLDHNDQSFTGFIENLGQDLSLTDPIPAIPDVVSNDGTVSGTYADISMSSTDLTTVSTDASQVLASADPSVDASIAAPTANPPSAFGSATAAYTLDADNPDTAIVNATTTYDYAISDPNFDATTASINVTANIYADNYCTGTPLNSAPMTVTMNNDGSNTGNYAFVDSPSNDSSPLQWDPQNYHSYAVDITYGSYSTICVWISWSCTNADGSGC